MEDRYEGPELHPKLADGRTGQTPQRARPRHGRIRPAARGDQLGVGGLSVDHGDYVAGVCPDGDWDLTHIKDAPPKNGPDPNQNGDQYVCVKSDTGSGNGNTGQNANNKDNSSDPVDNG